MKHIFLLLFLAICSRCLAQVPPSFDKIIISYVKGHNSWGDTGIYSKQELFALHPLKTGKYKTTRFLKITFTAGKERYKKDTVKIKTNSYSLISRTKIDSLYAELAITRVNFTYSFIKPFLKTPTKNDILTTSKIIDKYYKFEDDSLEGLKRRHQTN